VKGFLAFLKIQVYHLDNQNVSFIEIPDCGCFGVGFFSLRISPAPFYGIRFYTWGTNPSAYF